jgi:Tol biopolymer transport system component
VTDVSTFRARYNSTGQRIAFSCGGTFITDLADVCVIADVTGPIPSLAGIGDDAVDGKAWVTDSINANLTSFPGFAWDPLNPNRLVVARDSLVGTLNREASQLWFVNFNGLGATRLTPTAIRVGGDTLQVESLDWAPNGTFIVFSAYDQGNVSSIYRVEVATGAVTQLTFATFDDDQQPVVSPDNSTVLFIRNNFAAEGNVWNLFTVPAAGGPTTQVTAEFPSVFFSGTGLTHDWSPDGTEIVMVGTDGSPSSAIYRIPRTTTPTGYMSVRRLVSRTGASDVQPSWRP